MKTITFFSGKLCLRASNSLPLKKAIVKFPTNYFRTYFLSENMTYFQNFQRRRLRKLYLFIIFFKKFTKFTNYFNK